MSRDVPLRVGVLGAGAVAQLVHLPLLVDRSDVEVVALADADDHRANTVAERFGVPRVTETELLIVEEELDALIICTPNNLHDSMAVAALEAGRHVLVERPFALTPEGCREIVDAADKAGLVAMPGMSHRFRPEVSALRAFALSGELGRIHAGRAAWMNRAIPARRSSWRHRTEQSGGGALMDLGVQAIDLLLWILGQPKITRLTAVASRDEHEVEDAASLMMQTEDGAGLTVEVSWNFFSSEDRHYVRVLGTEGGGELPPLEICKQVGGRPMDVTPEQGVSPDEAKGYMKSYRREHDHFFRSIRGHVSIEPAVDQIQVMEVVRAAYRSIEEGREVTL